jgi:hypothetical protein
MSETLTIALGLVASVLLYSFQKWRDRVAELRVAKSNEYQRYLSALIRHFGYFGAKDDEGLKKTKFEMAESRSKILCIGSDEVVLAVNSVFDGVPKQPSQTDLNSQLSRAADLILAMRRDVFPKTRLSRDEVAKSLPVSVVPAGEM